MSSSVPFIDELDEQILLHREVHFGGSWDEMLTYYKKKGVGCLPEISFKRIQKLADLEKKGHNFLHSLPDEGKDEIKKAKKLYEHLRELYESKQTPAIQQKIADLILSEESHPKKEIDTLIKEGEKAIKPLEDLISSETFKTPLHPGYGRAPLFAAQILATLKKSSSLPILFSSLGDNLSLDEALIHAILSYGVEAKTFLLKKLTHLPFSQDNERAAIVISSMTPDDEIAKICLNLLNQADVIKNLSFAPYLVFPCEALKTMEERTLFSHLCSQSITPVFVRQEMELVIKRWVKQGN